MIDLSDIHKRFGPVAAVDGVSLSIRAAEFLTLLGPSGCGKTTLLRVISGFETPDSGRIVLDGQDVTALPPYRRDVNQVFQSYALFPHLSVWDNVAFGLKMKKVPRDEIRRRVEEGLAMVELAELTGRRPSQLSGGQRQRVALARALVNRPKVLLLDEPLAALDAKLRHAMQGELKRLQQKLGITFVFVTHDQSEALALSDRVAVMNAGKVDQLAPPAELYQRPASVFVAKFVGHGNLWDADVTGGGVARVGDLTLRCDGPTPGVIKVTVLVRPEDVILDKPGGAAAEVVESFFTGPTTGLTLRTAGGVTVHAVGHLPVGTRTTVSIDPSSVRVLAR